MTGQLTTVGEINSYLYAGRAIFTLANPRTGRRYTYKMIKDVLKDGQETFKVYLLQGDDNINDYHFLARVYIDEGTVFWQKHADCTDVNSTVCLSNGWSYAECALQYILFYTYYYLQKGGEFWHSGRCARCGRLLTTPESIATGLGPHCRRKNSEKE